MLTAALRQDALHRIEPLDPRIRLASRATTAMRNNLPWATLSAPAFAVATQILVTQYSKPDLRG